MGERARLAGVIAAVTALYVLGGLAGLWLADATAAAAVTPIWPPAGIAVAALVVAGLRVWPGIAAGVFIVTFIALRHVGVSAAIAVGDTLAYVAAAALTTRFAQGPRAFDRGPDVFRFAFSAGAVAVVAATIGTGAILFWGPPPPVDPGRLWFTWWVGNATSVVLYAPLCVLLVVPQPGVRAGRGELTALAGALALILWAVFGAPADLQRDMPLAVLLMPLMLWAAFRVDSRNTAALGVVMSIVSIYRTIRQFGPFEFGPTSDALLVVQFIVAMTTLLLLAVAAENRIRNRAESELRTLNDTLERRVQQRTAELTRVHDRLLESQAAAQIGNWEWDVAANRLWWSDEMCRIFGVASAPAGYEPYLALIHPDDRAVTDTIVRRAIQTGEPYTFEHRIVRPDGEQRVIHARGRAELDASGACRRLLGTGHDITERLRADEAQAQLRLEQDKLREAEDANRAKDAFLATLSHELRTPLNAALGWTHILRESIQADQRHGRIVQIIYRNLKLQARIVSDILDISRIAKGELPLERERVDVRAVFEVAVDMVRDAALARGVTIEIACAGSPAVIGDNRRLQQVAWNLLSNGVKFAAGNGRVLVSIQETTDHVEYSVEDDGPGIAPAFLPHVFEQFRQADSSITREHGGLGLGLAIAHEIVSMHHGTIVADNRPIGGAVFIVRLPKRGAPDDAALPPAGSSVNRTPEVV
jgi:PAS domain S-box-containing protein